MKVMEFMYRLVDEVVAEPRWFTISGLTLDALGAIVIVFGVFVSRAKIENLIKDAGVYCNKSPKRLDNSGFDEEGPEAILGPEKALSKAPPLP